MQVPVPSNYEAVSRKGELEQWMKDRQWGRGLLVKRKFSEGSPLDNKAVTELTQILILKRIGHILYTKWKSFYLKASRLDLRWEARGTEFVRKFDSFSSKRGETTVFEMTPQGVKELEGEFEY